MLTGGLSRIDWTVFNTAASDAGFFSAAATK
jgi:hypothetical protein